MNETLVYSGITNNAFDKNVNDYILNFDNEDLSISLSPMSGRESYAKQLESDLNLQKGDTIRIEHLLKGAVLLTTFPYRGFELSHGRTHRISIGTTPEKFSQAEELIHSIIK